MKHRAAWQLDITDTSFSFARNRASIAAEAAIDGIYIIRTSLPAEALDDTAAVGSYKSLALVEQAFRFMKTIDLRVRPIYHHWSADRVRWPIMSNGTCARSWRRCCSRTPTNRRPRPREPASWRRHNAHLRRSASRPPASPRMAFRCTPRF